MKKHHMPDMKESGVNVTPLIDVIMCLIIFFMLATKIGVSRGELKALELPKTFQGSVIKDFGNTLTLNIVPTNLDEPQITTMVNGSPKDIHMSELEAILTEYRKTHSDKAGTFIGSIIIRADRELAYKQLEVVLLACSNATISNIAYETGKGADTPAAAAAAQ